MTYRSGEPKSKRKSHNKGKVVKRNSGKCKEKILREVNAYKGHRVKFVNHIV